MKYHHFTWGPFIMKTSCPKRVLKRLESDGRQAERSWNHQLAGHLKSQYKYPEVFEQWFYTEMSEIFTGYRQAHCEYHGFEYVPCQLVYQSLWVNFMKAGDFNPPHIHGGDISGGLDEYTRHAITKISNIHFAVSKKSMNRILKMGENKKYVFFTGSPSIDEIYQNKISSKKELFEKKLWEIKSSQLGITNWKGDHQT